jgi:hypothetical protein
MLEGEFESLEQAKDTGEDVIKKPRAKAPRVLYVLFDSSGEEVSSYSSMVELRQDAFGPRFRDGYTVAKYKLVPGGKAWVKT